MDIIERVCGDVLQGRATRMDLIAQQKRLVSNAENAGLDVKAVQKQIVKSTSRGFGVASSQVVAAHVGCRPDQVDTATRLFVGSYGTNIQLQARAGAGKTTALVAKCGFLIDVLGVPPERIMLLTFNRSAREEIEQRLVERIGERGAGVQARTFHAAAVHVLRSTGNLPEAISVQDDSQETILQRAATISANDSVFAEARRRYEASSLKWFANCPPTEFNAKIVPIIASATNVARVKAGGSFKPAKSRFSDCVLQATKAYKALMDQEARIDTEAVLRRAAHVIKQAVYSGSSEPKWVMKSVDVLMIDEAQDLGAGFSGLVEAIVEANPGLDVYAVGDTEQAINAFAGASLEFFNGFTRKFGGVRMRLPMNRRSSAAIVKAGNAIGQLRGEDRATWTEGKASGHITMISAKMLGAKTAQLREEAPGWISDNVNRIVRGWWAEDDKAGRPHGSVCLIAQNNDLHGAPLVSYPDRAGLAGSGLVETSTAHASKGLEWGRIIVLDASSRFFPSQHPSRVLMEDYVPDEEHRAEGRRLFYVAVTRAQRDAAILSYTDWCSPAMLLKKHLWVENRKKVA